jgi:hypothetical protein
VNVGATHDAFGRGSFILGRYSFALADSIAQGELRPLRQPDDGDDLTVGAA